jgi:competence protein ComEC
LLVQFPTGQSLLVDAGGSAGSFEIGSRVVTPALWALGVRRLDWLAVTHPDLDHVGGALAVLRDLDPREVWEGVAVPPNTERAALRQAAIDEGIVWRTVYAGHTMTIGGVSVEIRHPRAPDWERQRTRNEDSLVLRLAYGDVEIWLTGDSGVEFEREISWPDDRRPLRVLKVAHHGSRSSSSEAFLDGLAPDVALISAGRSNLFGHPAPDVVSRLESRHAAIFRTDRDGAVVLETDGRRVEVRTMTGRRWTLWR